MERKGTPYREGKESERGKGRKVRGGKGKGTKGRRRGKRERKGKGGGKEKGGIFYTCDFSLGKTLNAMSPV